jgi:hypothetical protein
LQKYKQKLIGMARVRPKEISDFSTVDWQETAKLLLKRHLGGDRYQVLAAHLAELASKKPNTRLQTS